MTNPNPDASSSHEGRLTSERRVNRLPLGIYFFALLAIFGGIVILAYQGYFTEGFLQSPRIPQTTPPSYVAWLLSALALAYLVCGVCLLRRLRAGWILMVFSLSWSVSINVATVVEAYRMGDVGMYVGEFFISTTIYLALLSYFFQERITSLYGLRTVAAFRIWGAIAVLFVLLLAGDLIRPRF